MPPKSCTNPLSSVNSFHTLSVQNTHCDHSLTERVTAISVTCNSSHCISGLAQSLSVFQNIIIVDNNSTDGTAESLKSALPRATLIRNSQNLGFGVANNLALSATTTPYALLVNPDCTASEETVLALLRAVNDHPYAAIIAPALSRPNGNLELSYRWPRGRWRSDGPAATGACCVGFVSGAVMLLNLSQMADVGFFDENFFLYYEDEDLCERVFSNKKQIIVIPEIKFTHHGRGSVKGKQSLRFEFIRGYHHAQSKIIFRYKYNGAAAAHRLRQRTLLLALIAVLPRLVLLQPKYLARLCGRIVALIRVKIPDDSTSSKK